MFHIILVSPEIPPNTGNAIRLAANTGTQLHLVRPLGFELDDKKLRRAGLDYHEWATVKIHDDLASALTATGTKSDRIFAITTKGERLLGQTSFEEGDVFVFGSETSGLSPANRALFKPEQCIRIPMLPTQRSLNLSNTIAIVTYEAWRHVGFRGGL